jgi:hypothetical protein
MHSKITRKSVEQTNAMNSRNTSSSTIDEKVQEELITRMNTIRTSMLPGQSVGATANAQMHDMKPQVTGCMS